MELHSPGIEPTFPAMAAQHSRVHHWVYFKRKGQVDPRPGTTGTGPLWPSQKKINGNLTAASCLVAQLCPTLWDPMDCSLPGSAVHGILQARILEWAAISFSRESYQPRNQTQVSHTAGRFFTNWAMREARSVCVCVCVCTHKGSPNCVCVCECVCVCTQGKPQLYVCIHRVKNSSYNTVSINSLCSTCIASFWSCNNVQVYLTHTLNKNKHKFYHEINEIKLHVASFAFTLSMGLVRSKIHGYMVSFKNQHK